MVRLEPQVLQLYDFIVETKREPNKKVVDFYLWCMENKKPFSSESFRSFQKDWKKEALKVILMVGAYLLGTLTNPW